MNARDERSKYILLVVGLLLLALTGYAGYVWYPRFDLPAATGMSLLALAALAGIASLFSPCSFPLLMTLLAREATDDNGRSSTLLIRFAGSFAAGAALFLLLSGAALALGAAPLFARVTFTSNAGRILRAIVGVTLIGFGLWQIRGKSLNFGWLNNLLQPLWRAQARLRRQRSAASITLYGFGYILAGFGWTGPILAGLAGHALTAGGQTAAFIAFVVAALTMTLVLFTLATAVGLAQEQLVTGLKQSTHAIKRWSGGVLILVGTWLLALAVWVDNFAALLPV